MNDRTRSRRSAITSGMTTVAIDSDDRTEMREALEALLGPTTDPILLAGGASKEAWSVDAGGERLLVRRAAGGVIHRHTLSLKDEFDVLTVAYEAGVKVPRPIMYIEDLDERDLVGILDWEFAHLDDPGGDLGFGLVRAWRFGVDDKRLGGIGDVDGYLERYNELTRFDIRPEELDYWELAGNVGWAIGCLTQAQRHLTGQDRSVEFAILGRLGVEVEYEICRILEAA